MRWIRGVKRFLLFLILTIPTFIRHIFSLARYLNAERVYFLRQRSHNDILRLCICVCTHRQSDRKVCVHVHTLGKESYLDTSLTWGKNDIEYVSTLLLEGMRDKSSKKQAKLMKESQILCWHNFIRSTCSCPHIHSWEGYFSDEERRSQQKCVVSNLVFHYQHK